MHVLRRQCKSYRYNCCLERKNWYPFSNSRLNLKVRGSCYFQSNSCLLELQSYVCKMRDSCARYAGSAALALTIVANIIYRASFSTFCCSSLHGRHFVCASLVIDNRKRTKRQKCAKSVKIRIACNVPPPFIRRLHV